MTPRRAALIEDVDAHPAHGAGSTPGARRRLSLVTRRASGRPLTDFAHPPIAGRRSRLVHDLRHEASTVAVLASAIASSDEAGTERKRFAEQLIGETRKLGDLVAALCNDAEDASEAAGAARPARDETVRLDELVHTVVATFRSTSGLDVRALTVAATARGRRIDLWRAVSNLVRNAVAAGGERGRVQVRLSTSDGVARIDVEDDGPGMPDGPRPGTGLGLSIVEEVAAAFSGDFEIGRSRLGGCRARLLLPLA